MQPLPEEHLASWFCLFGLLTSNGVLSLGLMNLRILLLLSHCLCFFFLSVSYFFYARSANVVFSSKISLNVLCDSAKPKLTNQQATVHSELSISLASYLIKKWMKDSQLAAHLFLPLIKKKSSLWIFWFSDPRRHLNTLSVVSRENPCHSHSSDEGKKICKYAKFRWSKKVCVLICSSEKAFKKFLRRGRSRLFLPC